MATEEDTGFTGINGAEVHADKFVAHPLYVVTGSAGSNAALVSLLAALASIGLIVDDHS